MRDRGLRRVKILGSSGQIVDGVLERILKGSEMRRDRGKRIDWMLNEREVWCWCRIECMWMMEWS
ncbi:hypothetical protein, partial [Paenibacillus sp. Y412MC10]|uniref:hypothetical protein n=1 Tax=Geobacillus sp. (strain Y412MC10) TaxID=481743 RepID=UPI001C92D39F